VNWFTYNSTPFRFSPTVLSLVPEQTRSYTLSLLQACSLQLVSSHSWHSVLQPCQQHSSHSANNGLVERDNWSATRNDLVKGCCQPVMVIFSRCTIELGNVGSLAGPPFFNALTDMIGDDVAVQGVDYAADILGYLERGDPTGASTIASLIDQTVSQCPTTQIVISGYRYAIFFLLISRVLASI
jgi:Cutinase